MASTVFLLDNGSRRPESVLALRQVAESLAEKTGRAVQATALLYSHEIPAEELSGTGAESLEAAVRRRFTAGEREFHLLPFFFGPSNMLTSCLPQRLEALRKELGDFSLKIAPPLAEKNQEGDWLLVEILTKQVIAAMAGWIRPTVLLVDHGSPSPAVTAVRDRLGGLLRTRLGDAVAAVRVASMERRPGEKYDFNEPLLSTVLDMPEMAEENIVVALQFLLPGRHAGAGGDIAAICADARQRHPRQVARLTSLVGKHPLVIELLARRLDSLAD